VHGNGVTWFRQFQSMGVSTSSQTGSLEPSSCPCGRSGPPSRPRSAHPKRRRGRVGGGGLLPSPPLAQERGAVLDNYFHDLRVEPDSRGRRGLEQDRRIASPLTGLRSRPRHAILGTLSRRSSRPRYCSPRPISSSFLFNGMADHNAESTKSLEACKRGMGGNGSDP
jgi:hypothetical protein